jgi:serine/threonine protein phosphatase PrpC
LATLDKFDRNRLSCGFNAENEVMLKVKDTLRATVHLTFDGRVVKVYHGPDAQDRFAKEVQILKHLDARGCAFVPKLLEADAEKIRIITSNCGTRVDHLDEERRRELFAELEAFGVRHDDPDVRNVTYRRSDGRFCVIDFEFATLLPNIHQQPTQSPSMALKWSGLSDIGKVRKNNEDSFLGIRFDAHEVQRLGKIGESTATDHDFVFAVCDGMGGAKAGEYASNIAVDKITTVLPRSFRKTPNGDAGVGEVLAELFTEVNRAIVYLGSSYDECHGMETTLSLCWFTPGRMYFGHIGDSRIYHLAAGATEIRQLTHDDTHVGWLVRNGQINEREARTHPRRNVLQKALGGSNQFVEPQVGAVAFEPGDIFLLCSDGLTEGFYNHQMVDLLRESEATQPGKTTAQRLVAASIANDGRDNTTALVVRVA